MKSNVFTLYPQVCEILLNVYNEPLLLVRAYSLVHVRD